MEKTLTEIYRDERDHWYEKSMEYSKALAAVVGYMGGLAKWGDEIPESIRVKMLDHIVKTLESTKVNSEVFPTWIEEYNKEKEKILASLTLKCIFSV